MVVKGESAAVYGHKYSTVVPGTVTGENVVHELTNTDLIMKLHYLKTVYYFKHSDAIDGLTIIQLKDPMFTPLLNDYFPAAGRIRRTESGRPTIKCNDSGVRIVEAKCGRTLDEWLELGDSSGWKHLVPDRVLGPDLQFSPTVYMQFTKFKCGGMSIGLSWSHILGDALSATNFMNTWGQLLKGNPAPKYIQPRDTQSQDEEQTIDSSKPLSVRQVEPVGDCWLLPTNAKILTYCLQVTEANLKQLLQQAGQVPTFEMISAVIWQGLAKVRTDREPKLVTICRYNTSAKSKLLSNELKISIVTSSISPTNFGLPELAMMISKQDVDESKLVEELTYKDNGQQDFAFYGTNPTFVDMQGVDLHGLELKDQQPIKVDHAIDGISNAGTILVFKDTKGADETATSRVIPVMLILPEDEIMPLRDLLKSQFGIA